MAIIFSFGVGFDTNAHAFNYQTNKLQRDHRQLILTLHLYTDGHLQPVYHQPLTRADESKLNLFYALQVISLELYRKLFNFVLGHVSLSRIYSIVS